MPEFFSGLIFTITAQVVFITTKIAFIFAYAAMYTRHFDWFFLIIYWRPDAWLTSALRTFCFPINK